jgi:uncharacterized protein YuzE
MTDYPRVIEDVGSISIELAPGVESSRAQPLQVVLDFDQDGVVGIEVINIQFELGVNALGIVRNVLPTDGDGPKYAYDKTCDSIYVRLRPGRSLDQKTVGASTFLDRVGRVVALRAAWSV